MSLVFFDLETGGLLPKHPNIQLAAIAVSDDFEELDSMERKIRFNVEDCDPEALKSNCYARLGPEAWASAVSEITACFDLSQFLNGHKCVQMISKRTQKPYSVARLAGHNVATFDNPRLKEAFERAQMFLPAHPIVLDTIQLALWRYQRLGRKVDSFKLGSLCELLEIPVLDAHDALADVRMTVRVAKKLLLGK